VRRLPVTAALAALLLAGCGSGAPGTGGGPPPEAPGPRLTYVAVGASETVGYGAEDPLSQAWPQVLFRTALPRDTTFLNLGIPGETVQGALEDEVPAALRLAPDLVTVWLNVNDVLRGVSPADYERQLTTLVARLRRGGRTTVLLADTPPLDRLPAYLACLPSPPPGSGPCRLPPGLSAPAPELVRAVVAAYGVAAARVATAQRAVLVRLYPVAMQARQRGEEDQLYGPDGFHPSTEGHRRVAAAFAAALAGVRLR